MARMLRVAGLNRVAVFQLLISAARVEACTMTTLNGVSDIVASCCEDQPGGCSESFPATCSHGCARLLVPFVDECDDLLRAMPDETFNSFHLSQLMGFEAACRQTLVLYEHAAGAGLCVGESDGLPSRVNTVTDSCCEQRGVNTCTSGEPQQCDAACALEFLPYYTECLDRRAVVGGDMQPFNVLYAACTDGLPQGMAANRRRLSCSFPR
eukprot:SAG31_NODE_11851_length_992_cov_2.357223_1_plen_209_part_10